MGWATDLHDASFRGVQFECTSTADAVSKSLSIKQAPYSNDASIEDMGNNPRDISINAIYSGEDYKTWLDALEAALLATGPGELIHPIYGIQQVNVVNYNVDHDAENFDSCTIQIKFIQAKDKQRELFIPIKVQETIATEDIIEVPASALEKALKKLEQFDQNVFFAFVNNIRNGVNKFREGLGLIRSTIDNVLSPANFIVGLVDDVSQLVTFDTSISAISKWRDLANRIQRFEKLFTSDDSSNGSNTAQAQQALEQLWRATQVASTMTLTQKIVASVRSDMAVNKEINLTPIDLAVIRQQNRIVIQNSINAERLITTSANSVAQIAVYKTVADQVHLQIQELIETRPPISTTTIIVPCTLHWLAHQLYGDFSRANEIQRLNPTLENPALLLPGMELTIYAQ